MWSYEKEHEREKEQLVKELQSTRVEAQIYKVKVDETFSEELLHLQHRVGDIKNCLSEAIKKEMEEKTHREESEVKVECL